MSTGNQDFTERTKLRKPMEEQWLEWELISHAVVTVSRIFFPWIFQTLPGPHVGSLRRGTLPNTLINWWGGQLGPSRCLRLFPSQMKVPTVTLSIFPEDSCLPHQVRFPCQWLVAGPAASGPGPLRTQATHDAWLSPWRSVYPIPRHPISFWWPLYHIQTFAGDVMSLCRSFLPGLSPQSFSAPASSSARIFLCQETHASLHFYCTCVISSERVCPAEQERHHHHFCIPCSYFLALPD